MERRKKRIVKLTAFLFLLAASIFVMPQKAFADENEDVTLPTGSFIVVKTYKKLCHYYTAYECKMPSQYCKKEIFLKKTWKM